MPLLLHEKAGGQKTKTNNSDQMTCLSGQLQLRRDHSRLFLLLLLFFEMEGRANAVPTTRNYTPDSPDLDERRGQPHRSAMVRSRPGGTAYLITVSTSAPSKFNCPDFYHASNSCPPRLTSGECIFHCIFTADPKQS